MGKNKDKKPEKVEPRMGKNPGDLPARMTNANCHSFCFMLHVLKIGAPMEAPVALRLASRPAELRTRIFHWSASGLSSVFFLEAKTRRR